MRAHCLAAISSVLLACAASTPSDDEQPGALWGAIDVKWPAGADGRTTISVCWETAGFEADKETARASVVESWGAVSRIDFTDWTSCGAREDVDLRVRIADEVSHVGDRKDTPRLGRHLAGLRGGMTLNFVFRSAHRACGIGGFPHDACVRSLAIHEFGHALGFLHEQDRSDAPPRCPDGTDLHSDTPLEGLVLGPYDPKSIMNYCLETLYTDPKLSEGDIAGVRRWYGDP